VDSFDQARACIGSNMADLLGHQLLLTPTARCAVVLRLPAELKRLLNAAAQSGERVAFRVSEKNGTQQVCLVMAAGLVEAG
jgi:hypothetical protein